MRNINIKGALKGLAIGTIGGVVLTGIQMGAAITAPITYPTILALGARVDGLHPVVGVVLGVALTPLAPLNFITAPFITTPVCALTCAVLGAMNKI
jgi:hypothetical protein